MPHLAYCEPATVCLAGTMAVGMAAGERGAALGRFEFAAHRRCRRDIVETVKKPSTAQPSARSDRSPALHAGPASPRRLRVLIVEDEAVVAMELEMMLEDMNADVVGIAINAVDACVLAHEHRPDFVTMDINLKGKTDGVGAALDLFETYGLRSIFISSYSDPATQKRAEPCHAIAWIRKPIDTGALAEAVARVQRKSD